MSAGGTSRCRAGPICGGQSARIEWRQLEDRYRYLVDAVCAANNRMVLLLFPHYTAASEGEGDFFRSRSARISFWNEYIYLRFLPVYRELFPSESSSAMVHRVEMGVAFCEWLRREGFFHMHSGAVYFVLTHDIYDIYPDGASFLRLECEDFAAALNRLSQTQMSESLMPWWKRLLKHIGA